MWAVFISDISHHVVYIAMWTSVCSLRRRRARRCRVSQRPSPIGGAEVSWMKPGKTLRHQILNVAALVLQHHNCKKAEWYHLSGGDIFHSCSFYFVTQHGGEITHFWWLSSPHRTLNLFFFCLLNASFAQFSFRFYLNVAAKSLQRFFECTHSMNLMAFKWMKCLRPP